MASPPGAVRAVAWEGVILVHFPYHPDTVARVKELPRRRWDGEVRAWRVPDTPEDRAALRSVLGVEVADGGPLPPGVGDGERPAAAVATATASLPEHPLLLRFEEEMKLRGYAPRTRKSYLGHARRFLAALGERDPHGPALEAVLRGHVLERVRSGRMSRSYHNQLASALRLLCSTVLGRDMEELPLRRPRREQKLPTVLGQGELRRFLSAVRNPKHLAILGVAYSAGLRVSEVVRLRPEDLDRDRGLIQVRAAKGRKDRMTLLSQTALAFVDAYLEGAHPGTWLFPGPRPGRHLTARTVQKVVAQARVRAGITKPVTPHVLRHSFATHLPESGTDVRLIQELLRHASVRTTEIYTHVSSRHIRRIRSPLDTPPDSGSGHGID